LAAVCVATTGCSASPDDDDEGVAGSASEALRAGRQLSPEEVADDLRAVGVDEQDVPTMVCIAKWESTFFERARNRNRNGSTDYGLFQINDRYWLGPCGVGRNGLLDAAANARCAKLVLDRQGFSAWYGYRAHRRECDRYQLP